MATRKDRRHSGYVTPDATVSKKDLIKYDLFIDTFYDDWQDYRDGLRDWYSDFKKIKKVHPHRKLFNEELYEKRVGMNQKQKKLLRRRKAR